MGAGFLAQHFRTLVIRYNSIVINLKTVELIFYNSIIVQVHLVYFIHLTLGFKSDVLLFNLI